LVNPLDLDTDPCTVRVDDGAAAIDATLSGVLQNFGGLTKTGTGTLALTAANTYYGATTVNGGTLLVNSPGSLDLFSTVTVNTNGTLGGNGTINGSVFVADGGNLAPGASTGTLTIGGVLDISGLATGTAGKLRYELGPTNASDKLAVTGTLTIGVGVLGFSDFVFTNVGGLQAGTYKLITSAALNGGDALDGADLSGGIGAFTGTLQLNGNDLELVVSPDVTPSPTLLTNSVSGSTLSLSWPAGQGWRLEYQTNTLSQGLSTNWVPAAGSSISSTNITMDPTKPTTFYRLVYP